MSDQSATKPENKKPLARCRNQLMVLSLALIMVAQSIGCSSVSRLGFGEALTVAYRDMVWARRAFNLRFGNCDRPYAEHFENGFCAGYIDTANGGDGFVPALPPAEYRGFEFQSVDGAQCVNTWFEGYPAGVAAAKQEKAGNYHDVMISRMIDSAIKQENTKSLLPQDIPIVGANDARRNGPAAGSGTRTPPTIKKRNLPPVPIAKLAPTGLPPIISAKALAISPVETSDYEESVKSKLPEIVPASYGAKIDNHPIPIVKPDRPWESSRK